MPSIRQTFYGIFRQFSSSNIDYTPPWTPTDGQPPSLINGNGALPLHQPSNGREEQGSHGVNQRNFNLYQSLPRRRSRNNPVNCSDGGSITAPRKDRANSQTISSTTLPPSGQKRPSAVSTNGHSGVQDTKRIQDGPNNSKKDKSAKPLQETKCFIGQYLDGKCARRDQPEIYHGKTGVDLPVLKLQPLERKILSAYTGPDGGLTKVPPIRCKRPLASIANLDDELSLSFEADLRGSSDCLKILHNESSINYLSHSYLNDDDLIDSIDCRRNSSAEKPGYENNQREVIDWYSSSDDAFGFSTSLYERNPITHVHAGNPVADVFAVVARSNNCVLCLADGVNWGEKSRLAARCAVRGAFDYLNESLFSADDGQSLTTLNVFHYLLRAFHAGHKLIVQEQGSLTTLCVVVLCPLKNAQNQWVACACNVGDSLAFVYSPETGVREITQGSHDIQQMRDMRDAGGALGPVDGVNPELHNMTCSMTVVEAGDFVFITSDGISDNFDPVVGKFCLDRPSDSNVALKRAETAREPSLKPPEPPKFGRKFPSLDSPIRFSEVKQPLPAVEAYQRHELMLLRLEDLLRNGVTLGDPSVSSAKALCENLVNFAIQLTSAKRKTLEDPELYRNEMKNRDKAHAALLRDEQKRRRHMVRQKIAEMPGKLDHASVVAYQIPSVGPDEILAQCQQSTAPNDRFNFVTDDQITAKFESGTNEVEDETWLLTLVYTDERSLGDNRCKVAENSRCLPTPPLSAISVGNNTKEASVDVSASVYNNADSKSQLSHVIPDKLCHVEQGHSQNVPSDKESRPKSYEFGQKLNEKPDASKLRNFSKTVEKFVGGVRRPKKHGRNSPQRHTVAIDSTKWSETLNVACGSRVSCCPVITPTVSPGRFPQPTPPSFQQWNFSRNKSNQIKPDQVIVEDRFQIEKTCNTANRDAIFVRKNLNSSQTSLTVSEVQLAFANLKLCPESYV